MRERPQRRVENEATTQRSTGTCDLGSTTTTCQKRSDDSTINRYVRCGIDDNDVLKTKRRLNDQQVRAMWDRRQRRVRRRKRRLNDQQVRAMWDRRQRRAEKRSDDATIKPVRAMWDRRHRRVENEATTQRSTGTCDLGSTTTTCQKRSDDSTINRYVRCGIEDNDVLTTKRRPNDQQVGAMRDRRQGRVKRRSDDSTINRDVQCEDRTKTTC